MPASLTMPDTRPTYDIASPHIAEYVQPLWPGALAMPVDTRDEEGRRLSLNDDHLSGRAVLLAFLNDSRETAAVPVLAALAANEDALRSLDARIIVISSCSDAAHNARLKTAAALRAPIAGDATGALFASYGLHKNHGPATRLVVITPYRQVRAYFDPSDDLDETLETVMELLQNGRAAEEARWSPPHAPVLLVPNVLSPEECAKLVESFETGAPFMIRPPRPGEIAGSYRIPVYEHDRQDRVDQIIKDQNTLALLDERLFGRIVPMIKKAFGFDVTRRENLHIARYVGERGGHRMGHRDNTSAATAYRRFALSMPLNDDYEGGEIVFREFSPKGYRPDPGTALIFSSSLLHEVMETTKGVRYNLISHLFNEQTLPGGQARAG